MRKQVLIVGGGVVGLSSALGLSELVESVQVFDANSLSLECASKSDMRVYAINEASRQLFETLGVWGEICATRVSPYEKMYVWDARSEGVLSFDCLEFAKSSLGFIVEERVIKQALLKALRQKDNVRLHEKSDLMAFQNKEDNVYLHTNNRVFKGHLLIGADGAKSWVKKQAHFETKVTSYGHHALVATLKTEKPHEKTAWQRFTEEGPLAFLPLSDPHTSSIVYSSSKGHTEKLMALNDDAFLKDIEHCFESKLGRILQTSKRITFPLYERHAVQYVKRRTALMGDALHTIHPLAGLGMNLGLKDVASFLACVKNSSYDCDSFRLLRQYERERKGHNTLVIKTMAGLKKLFSLGGPPSLLRGWGMNMITQNTLLKNMIAHYAFMS